MARIPQIDYNTASPQAKEAHDAHLKVGKMTNMKRTLLNNVPAFKALMEWYPLRDEAAKFLDELEINFFCFTISSANECLICSMFFTKILVDNGIDYKTFEFTDRQKALIDFGKALVETPRSISDDIFDRLHSFLTDEQIVLLDAFGAIMIATNLINSSLQIELDDYLESYTKL